MKTVIRLALIAAALALLAAANAPAILFTNLYTFSAGTFNNPTAGIANGGSSPQAALLFSSNVLYGTTANGGSNNLGTVFEFAGSVNIHTFSGGDGAYPHGTLVASSSNILFGTTIQGGAYNGGTVFVINTNGAFNSLFSFAFTNGANPQAGLVLAGNTLYGTTSKGGAYGAGTIFAMNSNGTGFTNFYNFNYTNGANPEADLLLLGNTLYGTAANGGGSNGWGTIFAINTNGTGFTTLFTFSLTNGANPYAGLALVSNMLCGTTVSGGSFGEGTVFLIATNGTGYTVLHNFSDNNDGYIPYSRLFVSSNGASSYTLYGTTSQGGTGFGINMGTVFSLNVSGTGLTLSGYSVLSNLGTYSPAGGVVLAFGSLYGTAMTGGGAVFSVSTSGGSDTIIHKFTDPTSPGSNNGITNSDGAMPLAGLALSGNTLYGTSSTGGTYSKGTIFAINTDGSGFANLVSLNNPDSGPWAGLTLSGNMLYGTTTSFLPDGYNIYSGIGSPQIFALEIDGTGFTNLSGSSGGPLRGNVVSSGNTLYGTTQTGNDYGTVFSVNTDGSDFTNLYSFNFTTGEQPLAGLILSGNTLYGTTSYGGSNDDGEVFAINTDGTGFTNLFSFNGADGFVPQTSLILSGNTLYGTTKSDTIRGCGTIFTVNTDGTGFTNLYIFNGFDGANPLGNLVLSGNTLYGTASSGGSGGYGNIFAINTDGTSFTDLYNFTGANDGATPYDGLILSGNTLYGTTSSGGSGGNGTVFALSLGPIPLCVQPDGNNVVLTWGNPVFSLQSGPTADGPYTNILGAASPYTNNITSSQQFFRLQAP